MEETKSLTVEVLLEESLERTDAKASVSVRGTRFTGWGRAKRNPSDPQVPKIGEELAIGRALGDLSNQLLDAAADAIEDFEGQPVHVHA